MKVKNLFKSLNVEFNAIELDLIENGNLIHETLKKKIERTSVPQVYIKGEHIGGCDDVHAIYENGKLSQLLQDHSFEYDLIVIGGGSGGLAASKVNTLPILFIINFSKSSFFVLTLFLIFFIFFYFI